MPSTKIPTVVEVKIHINGEHSYYYKNRYENATIALIGTLATYVEASLKQFDKDHTEEFVEETSAPETAPA